MHDARLEAGLVGRGGHAGVPRGARGGHDPVLVRQVVGQVQTGPGRQGVLVGQDRVEELDHDRVAAKVRVPGRGQVAGGHGDGHVQTARAHHLGALLGLGLDDLEAPARMAVAQSGQCGCHQVADAGGEGAHAHHAPVAVGVLGQVGGGAFHLREDHVGALEQHARGAGQQEAASLALDEGDAGLLGQGGELLGDRRRRDIERLRGGGHRAMVVEGLKKLQAPNVDHVSQFMTERLNIDVVSVR